jgi:hypothetical protein
VQHHRFVVQIRIVHLESCRILFTIRNKYQMVARRAARVSPILPFCAFPSGTSIPFPLQISP